eukprot:5917593-Alexandrium_andersonii.AAC.1
MVACSLVAGPCFSASLGALRLRLLQGLNWLGLGCRARLALVSFSAQLHGWLRWAGVGAQAG